MRHNDDDRPGTLRGRVVWCLVTDAQSSLTEIAELLSVSPRAVSAAIDDLEAQRWVTRQLAVDSRNGVRYVVDLDRRVQLSPEIVLTLRDLCALGDDGVSVPRRVCQLRPRRDR
jgi:DNA-binding Lrp family transcriptional regulator